MNRPAIAGLCALAFSFGFGVAACNFQTYAQNEVDKIAKCVDNGGRAVFEYRQGVARRIVACDDSNP